MTSRAWRWPLIDTSNIRKETTTGTPLSPLPMLPLTTPEQAIEMVRVILSDEGYCDGFDWGEHRTGAPARRRPEFRGYDPALAWATRRNVFEIPAEQLSRWEAARVECRAMETEIRELVQRRAKNPAWPDIAD